MTRSGTAGSLAAGYGRRTCAFARWEFANGNPGAGMCAWCFPVREACGWTWCALCTQSGLQTRPILLGDVWFAGLASSLAHVNRIPGDGLLRDMPLAGSRVQMQDVGQALEDFLRFAEELQQRMAPGAMDLDHRPSVQGRPYASPDEQESFLSKIFKFRRRTGE